jgi:hypothetical protein
MKELKFSIRVLSYSFIVFSLFLLCSACTQTTESIDPVEGVWERSVRYWVLDDDTIYADPTPGLQHKIYYDGYVMWTADPAADSSEWYGYGTYQLNNNTLVEKLSTMSLPLRGLVGSDDEWLLTVEYDENFYKQEMPRAFRDTIYLYVEEWKKLN